ncbi:MAG: hypothetical protein CL840_12825 [Crocinitomicaceae bacterium]|nr:hypothetical protein [Crocinitomicaceae bacterium]|tara:strand:- start:896 stop:1471 length:576 start_codon:yes stop_codon:yes gene_type:complete
MFQRYYRILNIDQNAGPEEVKRAYRQIAKECHPDRNPDPAATQRFIDATQAYERIIEKLKRPHLYKYAYSKAAYHRAKKNEVKRRKSGYEEHPADRGRRYSKMNYKKYKQKSSAFTDTHNFWIYRLFYYSTIFFIWTLLLTIIIVCTIAFIDSLDPIILFFLIPIIYVATKSNKFFQNWKKDFKNVFKDQD